MDVSEVSTAPAPSQSAGRRAVQTIGQAWAWLFLIILIVFFSLTGEGFLSAFNLQSILANMAIVLIMALGQTFVILSSGIDLSTGFVMGMASVVGAVVMSSLAQTMPVPLAIIIGMVAALVSGLIAGLVNGLIIARLNVPPFIATLGMFSIARGIGFVLSGGMPQPISIQNLGQLGNGYLLYYHPQFGVTFLNQPAGLAGNQLREVLGILPHPVTLSIILVVGCYWVLSRTKFGLYTYAIGGNKEASLRAGIPVQRHTINIYMLSAGMAAIAGLVYNVRFTNGAANAGEALLITSIAAVVIGGASMFGGEGTIIGTLIGSLIIAVITNGFVILGINAFWQFIAVGVVIILAVLIDQAKSRLLD
ncbi:MAG: sugar ABC transporter permease [Chloroflexota bacterium]|nr:MAG: sugar ABC transporter permease [Chloroflexota bacterium]